MIYVDVQHSCHASDGGSLAEQRVVDRQRVRGSDGARLAAGRAVHRAGAAREEIPEAALADGVAARDEHARRGRPL